MAVFLPLLRSFRTIPGAVHTVPDFDCTLEPIGGAEKEFSKEITSGVIDVKGLWGNEELDEGDTEMTQDEAVGTGRLSVRKGLL
ncbi:hypothetical protein PRK78_003779 [Emydomyces testavorans]|uniref:Uncharacterized protein n=1 Tax=Emydomyces testavorans TaxID=2070801 RepID=A0AAF0DIV4_9EURO|nr:hypothetical protein PRK78_003779 [Emydomyces testavorans]